MDTLVVVDIAGTEIRVEIDFRRIKNRKVGHRERSSI